MNIRPCVLIVIGLCALALSQPAPTLATPQFFEGRKEINGITLLQDDRDPRAYYYVPPFPRLATQADGTPAFSFIRYQGGKDEEGEGGLFNAIIEFTLPQEVINQLERDLQKLHSGAKIAGAVPFTDPADDLTAGQTKTAAFRVVSATLGDEATSTVTSGSAALAPNGRTVIAAKLDATNAALLWKSFQQNEITDVAFEMDAAYFAKIDAFNAVVEASMETVYRHFSILDNNQGLEGKYHRDQLQNIVDELSQEQIIKITSTETGAAFDISSARWEKLVEVVTDKLIETLFDTKTGWSRPVEREVIGEDIQGRVEGGTVSSSFLGAPGFASGESGYREHTDYVPDDQYVLKQRDDIRINTFRMDLTRSQVIRAPYVSTGNIGGLFKRYDGNPKYFQVIDLDDVAMQKVPLSFLIDGSYVAAFDSLLDSVTVDVAHGEGANARTHSIRLAAADITSKNELSLGPIELKRLGSAEPNWRKYRYRVRWNVRGRPDSIEDPAGGGWFEKATTTPRIAPPLERTDLKIDIDPEVFKDPDVRAVTVELMARFLGEADILRTVHATADEEARQSEEIALFHDPNAKIAARVTYIRRTGPERMKPVWVADHYVLVGKSPAGDKP